jgi:hypothetical protein
MAIPLTLAGIGSVALTQGISFLYAQAGEVIRRWRGRKDTAAAAEPLTVQVPAALGGQVLTATPDLAAVEARSAELLRLRAALSNYADDVQPADPGDAQLIHSVTELRAALEAILGTHLTFTGEDRPATGQPVVIARVQVDDVQGTVTGVQVDDAMTGGRVDSSVTAADVKSGGSVTGVRVCRLGAPPPPPPPGG